jgi:cytochrome oxidase Cu insertion factor (SCO1/SenC/PrrC family)
VKLLTAAAIATLLAAGAAPAATDFEALALQAYEPPKAAPAFALPDVEGRVKRLEDFRGKALLLFFWATW